MTNTALRAGLLSAGGTCPATTEAERRPQSANNTHMVFANEEHEKFYFEKLEKARYQDCYHKALIYILGISEDTRHDEGIDLMLGNIELSGLEVSLVNVMSREIMMRSYVEMVMSSTIVATTAIASSHFNKGGYRKYEFGSHTR